MIRKFRINRKQRKQIEDAVTRAEARTSGEIVPIIVRQSHDYWWVHWYWAAVFVTLCSVTLWWMTSHAAWAQPLHQMLKNTTEYQFWSVSVHQAILLQMCSAFFGFAIAFFEPVKRMVIPKRWAERQVHQLALANFMENGLCETRDRTGVLIFISHLEHQVEILADRGINEATPEGFWDKQVDTIVKSIHRGHVVDGLIKAILDIGEALAKQFPKRADDTNELSNELRTGYGFKPAPADESASPTETDGSREDTLHDELDASSEDTLHDEPPGADGGFGAGTPIPSQTPRASSPLKEMDEKTSTEGLDDWMASTPAPPPDFPSSEPDDTPLGNIDLQDEGETQTNFDLADMPSLHLDETDGIDDDDVDKKS